jgi:F-type H+-transporting ATPase subunit c
MVYFLGLAIALGLGLPVAVIGAGIGQGNVGSGAMAAMARQPEMAGKIQTGMIIALAFVESLVIYALLIFFLMLGKLPDTAAVMEAIKGAGG